MPERSPRAIDGPGSPAESPQRWKRAAAERDHKPASLLLLALLLLGCAAPAVDSQTHAPVFCYLESVPPGVRAADLDFRPCTYVVEAFALLDDTGRVTTANGIPRLEVHTAARSAGAKVLVSVGGQTVPGETFTRVTESTARRDIFVQELMELVESGGFDGVDLDWEFPAPAERGTLVELVGALREGLSWRAQERLLTVTVSPGYWLPSYDLRSLAPLVDYAIYMGYDFRNPALGPWASDRPLWMDGATAPIEGSVRSVASEILRRGLPREKLIVALPLYTSQRRPWWQVRAEVLAASAPLHPEYLEKEIGGEWITDPEALEAKARAALWGSEIAGGGAIGLAVWQLGHQGSHRDLGDALLRALAAKEPSASP